jgi:hypothetical protein
LALAIRRLSREHPETGKAVEKNKAASKTVQDRAEKLVEQGRKLGGQGGGGAAL